MDSNSEQVAALKALRDHLKAAVFAAEPKLLPALCQQYRLTLKDLERVRPASSKSGPLDEVLAKRKRRLEGGGRIG